MLIVAKFSLNTALTARVQNEIYCEYCGTKITDDNVKTFEQKHDEGRSEILVSGYKCSAWERI